jgi:hypothetical protein
MKISPDNNIHSRNFFHLFVKHGFYPLNEGLHRYVLYQSAQCYYGIYALCALREGVQVPGHDTVPPALHVVPCVQEAISYIRVPVG